MTAIFPGSFDPFTIGHLDLLERGLHIFDKIIVGVGINYTKKTHFSEEERINIIYKAIDKLNTSNEVSDKIIVTSYEGTTVDFARQFNANAILRGARTTIDFETEKTLADANRALTGIETIILISKPELSYISSTLVRDLLSHGKDISQFLP